MKRWIWGAALAWSMMWRGALAAAPMGLRALSVPAFSSDAVTHAGPGHSGRSGADASVYADTWAPMGIPNAADVLSNVPFLLAAALAPRPRPASAGLDIRFGVMVALYVIAKCLENLDTFVFECTGDLVSGHTLKHLAAAAAAWPVLTALRLQGKK